MSQGLCYGESMTTAQTPARAVAAVVSRWPSHAETGFMVELRADYTAAANLAANYTNPNRKVRGMSVEGYTAVWATCVRVVDA
jgi:hypothetical protein